MKHKTWFRLVIKAIGVLLLALGIPDIVQVMSYYLLIEWPNSPSLSPNNWMYGMIAPAFQTGIGAYLLLDGRWIIDKCIPSNRPYCPECGYDLSQSRGEKCQECGVVLPAPTPSDQAREAASGKSS